MKRARWLCFVNGLLARVNLGLQELGAETAGEREDRLMAAHVDAAERAWTEAERLRGHLVELDELLAGVGYSSASRAARRVLDVALGRAERIAA